MAKKNLINADMLLAKPLTPSETPKTTETTEILAPKETSKVVEKAEIPSISAPKVEEMPTLPTEPPLSTPSETVTNEAVSSLRKGLSASEIRATFIVTENILEKIKAIAYWERLNIKEVVQDALENYISTYENKNGTVKNLPPIRQK